MNKNSSVNYGPSGETVSDVKFAGNDSKDKMYEPKHKKKLVRVLTVVAYVFSVSLAAIMLSLFYVFIYNPDKPGNKQGHEVSRRSNVTHEGFFYGHGPDLHNSSLNMEREDLREVQREEQREEPWALPVKSVDDPSQRQSYQPRDREGKQKEESPESYVRIHKLEKRTATLLKILASS